MNRCSICDQSVSLFCPQCVENTFSPKDQQVTKLDRQIQLQNDQIVKILSSHKGSNELFSNQQLGRQLKQKVLMKKRVLQKKMQLNQRKHQLQDAKKQFLKRVIMIQKCKQHYKQLEASQIQIKTSNQNICIENKSLLSKNKGLIQSKAKDIQYAYFGSEDAKILSDIFELRQDGQIVAQSVLRSKQQSDEATIDSRDQFYETAILNFQSVRLREERDNLFTFSQVRVIQRNVAMIACLLRLLKLWVPHQFRKQNSSLLIKDRSLVLSSEIKDKGGNQMRIDLKFVDLFQANLQYLYKVLDWPERPLLCPSANFITKMIESKNWNGQDTSQVYWKSSLQSLKAQNIQVFCQIQSNSHFDGCLPPLAAVRSESSKEEDEEQYQMLIASHHNINY